MAGERAVGANGSDSFQSELLPDGAGAMEPFVEGANSDRVILITAMSSGCEMGSVAWSTSRVNTRLTKR
jgi:hypothetical protein